MTVTDTTGVPFTLNNDATVIINDIKLNCIINHLSLKPTVNKVTANTMCAQVDYPGSVKWELGMTLHQSFEDSGAYHVLWDAIDAGVPVPYSIIFNAGPVSDTNPEFSGMLIPEPVDIVDSDAGALVEVQFTWSCTDEPTRSVTPGAGVLSAPSSTTVDDDAA